MHYKIFLLVLVLGATNCENVKKSTKSLPIIYQWKQLKFQWPTESDESSSEIQNSYIPENNLPLGIEPYKDKIFITIPRWKLGVAASLGYVPYDENDQNESPEIIPYPNWDAHHIPQSGETPTDTQLVSVFRVRVDKCDRLWVLDKGEVNTLADKPYQVRRTAIIIYDLKTNTQIRRYDVKPEHLKEDTFYANIVVDSAGCSCDDTFAYLGDIGTYSMLVYSFAKNDAWKIVHNYFHMESQHCDFTIGGINFQWTDGLFGIALGPVDPKTSFRTAYFHAVCGRYEFTVSTSVLQNETLATNSGENFHKFKPLGYRGKSTQSTTSDLDTETGVIFMTMLMKDGFACYNTNQRLSPKTVHMVAQDSETLQFTNEVRIGPNRILYVLSDRLQRFTFSTMDPNDYNYRIFAAPIDKLIENTSCK